MAKRRNNILMIVAIIVSVIVVGFMLMKRGEKYTPGDTMFHDSEIPANATVIQPSEIEKGKRYETPNGEYHLMFRQDGELVWANRDGEILWFLVSEGAGDNAKARFLKDGNICVVGTNKTVCSESKYTGVPDGQHLIIITDDGQFYIDRGLGRRRRHIFYPPLSPEDERV